MNIHPMWNTYPTLSKELTTTLRLMEQAVQIDNQEIQAAVHDMIHSGGKLLRPAYQLLFSYFGEQRDPKKATALAASIELLHTATLVHDDIVDEAVYTAVLLPKRERSVGKPRRVSASSTISS